MRCATVLLIALGCGAAPAAHAQGMVGDTVAGRSLALKTCAACHRVDKGERGAKIARAPSFQEVANEPAVTPMSLRVFLQLPHTKMPDLVLSREDTDNVVAYILSLQGKDR